MKNTTTPVQKASTTKSITSRELSDHEISLRVPAFNEGVAIADRLFFFARRSLLHKYAPQKPPFTAVRNFSARFVRLVEPPLRGIPDRHRFLQTTEFLAGLMCQFLDEGEWHLSGLPLNEHVNSRFPPSLLPSTATGTRRASLSSSHARAWKARAHQDGRDLVDDFLEVRLARKGFSDDPKAVDRKTTPDAPTSSTNALVAYSPRYILTNCFIHGLVHMVMEATRRYPRHLGYFLLPHLLGGFVAGLIALDCESATPLAGKVA
jgi:hypothetical protein